MRRIIFTLCAALTASGATTQAKENMSILRLSNMDNISGDFVKLSKDNLSWSAPWLEEAADFKLTKVLDVSMTSSATIPNTDHVAIIKLKNGDVARGQLNSITDETIELNTWYAGIMSFNRKMVASVKIENSGPLLYHGPNSSEDWQQSEDPAAWKYQRSAFISSGVGSIAKDELLPDECSILFTIQHKSNDLNMKVNLFSDSPDSKQPTSGYELSFRRSSCYLKKGTTSTYIGRGARIPELSQNDQHRFEIKASKRTGKVALFVDGRLVEVWADPNIKDGRYGKALHFISMNNSPIRISNIAVKSWNGEIDQLPNNAMQIRNGFRGRFNQVETAPKEKPKPNKNEMELANGDSITGQVMAIQDGIATLETPLGEISVPVARMRTLSLKNLGEEASMLDPDDIRVNFPDGTSLVFRLEKIGDNTITGSSQNFGTDSKFGTAVFDISAMEKIEFNIHNPNYTSIRAADAW